MKKRQEIIKLIQVYSKYINTNKPTKVALVVGMRPWSDVIKEWVYEADYIQINRHFNSIYFKFILKPFMKTLKPTVYIWGYKAPAFFINYIREHQYDIWFLEDGFIRSAPDDNRNAPPLSIVMDSQAPYFDTTGPNDLTDFIKNFDFNQPSYDNILAKKMLNYYISHRVSKYNHQEYVDVKEIYGKKEAYRILILGQVPEDDSIKYGNGQNISVIDLVNAAIKDFPFAQIIVKPHPMALLDIQIMARLKELNCLILDRPLHLVDALETVDHIYTITSLAGLEALIRGKKVTALGKPFYKGYNLTENEEILRPLTIEQLYFVTFMLYNISSQCH